MSKSKDSRIPVPLSPSPLRRSSSLRLRNDSLVTNHVIQSTNHTAGYSQLQDDGKSALRRGNSFMERGERYARYGTSPSKARNIETKALKIPQSPSRIRSLVSG